MATVTGEASESDDDHTSSRAGASAPRQSSGGRLIMIRLRGTSVSTVAAVLLAALLYAQAPPPSAPLTLVSRDGRRPIPTTGSGDQETVALEDMVPLFGVTLREDALAGGLTIGYRGRTIVMSAGRPTASVNGRVVTFTSPVTRAGDRWMVPLDFLPRALAPLLDQRVELRRASRLVVLGDIRVPRVTVRVDGVEARTRLQLDVSPAAPVVAQPESGRVVLQIEADALDVTLPQPIGGPIEAVRAGEQPATLVVALDARSGPPRITTTGADGMTRVVIEVALAADGPPEPSAAAPPPPAPDVALADAVRVGLRTIVVDPGHGGTDAGVRGTGGAEEKSITLDVARRLRTLLESRLGVRVILTRDDDRAVGPDERAALANNSKADLFVSLHANAAPSAVVAGVEVFHTRLDSEGEDTRRRAEADAVTLPTVGGGSRTIEVVRWDLAQAAHVDASTVFAGLLEEELRTRVTMSPRSRQQATLRVLVGTNMPAALVEIGYLTNPAQEKAMRGEAYQSLVAQAIYESVARFREYLTGRGR